MKKYAVLLALVWVVQGFGTAQDVTDKLSSLPPAVAKQAKVVYDPDGEAVTNCTTPTGPCEIVNAKWLVFIPKH